ncbi:MAG: GAF domain-containing protein, partial [Anaerolineae bacterium]
NVKALQQMADLPQIVSMEAAQQQPILKDIAELYPHLSLVSTIDLYGANVARSDGRAPGNYRREFWHIGARNGVPVTFDVVADEVSGQPVLVMAVPIRRESGTIVGVAMFAGGLDAISQEVQATTVGESGFAYLVDGRNRVVAHPDRAYAAEMRDLNYYDPVFALRGGQRGIFDFSREGRKWRSYVDELENGWGVIVQQPLEDLQAPVRQLQTVSWVTIVLGTITLLILVSLTIRQSLRPIDALTETATAIAAGELDRTAPVESEDEIGTLARAFNSMTQQLRSLIDNLERQVLERTQALARRSVYLEATAEVGRAATSILERERLGRQVVELIRERFDLYYVGLFLVDDLGEWAVLQAGTGEAGQRMLERGHRIRVGEGMIGWSVAHGEARVAGMADEDMVRVATAELPETRSEVALPLRSRDRVLGALSVQHTEADAFDLDTIAVLQTMADQVAVALDNAILFAESREALESARRAYGEVSRRTWAELLRTHPDWGYRYAQRQVLPAQEAQRQELMEAEQGGEIVVHNPPGDGREAVGTEPQVASLAIPLKVRDDVVGVLGFRKRAEDGAWTDSEMSVLENFATRLEVALESARLYEETQQRAARDRLLAEVVGRIRETLDVETVLRTTVQEVRQALNLPDVAVRLRQVETHAPGIKPGDDSEGGPAAGSDGVGGTGRGGVGRTGQGEFDDRDVG